MRTYKVSKYRSCFSLLKKYRPPSRLTNDRQKHIWLKRLLFIKVQEGIKKYIAYSLRPRAITIDSDMFPFIGGDVIYGSGL